MTPIELIRAGQPHPARPWPRFELSPQAWRDLADALRGQPAPVFEALWADTTHVHALFTDRTPLLVSTAVEAGLFEALSPGRPEASLFERAVSDLWGHVAANAADSRPWLDHGAWPVLRPMLPMPVPNSGQAEAPDVRLVDDPALHRLFLGPVRPGGEPALVAVAARGETMVQAEARLGYGHRGVLACMRGQSVGKAVKLAARTGGEGPVAHALGFARAVEAALEVVPPPRAVALRTLLAGVEAVGAHLLDIETALREAGQRADGPSRMREALKRAAAAAFGHRLLMDVVVPGGLERDAAPGGVEALLAALAQVAPPWWGSGVVRRAAGTGLAVRRQALARSLAAVLSVVLPDGPVSVPVPYGTGEGLGRAEGARGAVWHWVRLRDGRVAECFARDPAWINWPRWQAACPGAPLADLGLLMAVQGLTVGGMDL